MFADARGERCLSGEVVDDNYTKLCPHILLSRPGPSQFLSCSLDCCYIAVFAQLLGVVHSRLPVQQRSCSPYTSWEHSTRVCL